MSPNSFLAIHVGGTFTAPQRAAHSRGLGVIVRVFAATLTVSFQAEHIHQPARNDLYDIRLGVRTAGAIDRPLSDLGENDLHAENS